jgi:DNA-binding MarR family transcriptional regulator
MKILLDIYQPLSSLMKHMLQKGESQVRMENLTFIEIRILMIIYNQHGDFCTREDLASELEIDRSNVSRAVQKMARKGIVEFAGDEEDRRLSHLILTKKGKELEKDIFSVDQLLTASLKKTLSNEEINTLSKLLQKAAAGMVKEP